MQSVQQMIKSLSIETEAENFRTSLLSFFFNAAYENANI
jgi:hypothetical protein